MVRDVVAAIPAYQCEASLGAVVRGCREYLERVVVVDDGSRDRTAEVGREAGAEVESLPTNQGKGTALRRALELALAHEPAAILLLDADGQHDPRDIPAFLDAWAASRPDLIVGSRMGESDKIPRPRFWTNHIGSLILSHMTGYDLEDSQSGFRLVSAALARRWHLSSNGYAIESEMLIKSARLGARLVQVPIRTIYDGAASHYQPVRDTVRIVFAAIQAQVFDEP